MQKLGRLLLGIVLGLGLLAGRSVAEAHTMTLEERTIVVVKADGSRAEIKPGNPLAEVSDALGSDYELKDFGGDGMRMARYIYENKYTFYARTFQDDARAAEELKLTGYSIKDSSVQTLSGIKVGMLYKEVADKFGPGEELDQRYEKKDGTTKYIYDLYNGVRELSLKVDGEGKIREIEFRQEM